MYLLATAWRIFEYEHLGWTETYYRFDTRMSGLVLGALLAIWLPHNGRISQAAPTPPASSPASCSFPA